MIGDKLKKNQSGFTLAEMIVATGIFAIVSVVAAQLFITSSRAQQRGGVSQKIQSDARVMMAQLSDRIRYGSIDYSKYLGAISSPVEELHLIDENGQEVFVRKGSGSCPDVKSSPCLEISENGGPFFSMSSKNFQVNVVQFYIDPAIDPNPSGGPAGPDIQPRVTYVLGINSSSRTNDVGTTYVQSSVSSRVYFR